MTLFEILLTALLVYAGFQMHDVLRFDAFAQEIWEALDEDNKISLYVRYTDLGSGDYDERLINRNER